MIDLPLLARKEIIKALRADAGVTALVPAARVYGEESPASPVWPFIRYGFVTATPVRGTCLNGREVAVTIHAFAKGPGTDAVSAIGNAVERAMENLVLVTAFATATITLDSAQIVRDTDEASAYHWFGQFGVTVAA